MVVVSEISEDGISRDSRAALTGVLSVPEPMHFSVTSLEVQYGCLTEATYGQPGCGPDLLKRKKSRIHTPATGSGPARNTKGRHTWVAWGMSSLRNDVIPLLRGP